jgi:hypothetical protein
MVMGGLFYLEPLNGQTLLKEDKIDLILPTPAMITAKVAYGPEISAKSNVRKSETISATAKCSCSLFDDYKNHHAQWVNYCPQCNKYGTLIFEKTGDCPEGMIRCTRCDADFCAVHGKEHTYSGSKYLRSA